VTYRFPVESTAMSSGKHPGQPVRLVRKGVTAGWVLGVDFLFRGVVPHEGHVERSVSAELQSRRDALAPQRFTRNHRHGAVAPSAIELHHRTTLPKSGVHSPVSIDRQALGVTRQPRSDPGFVRGRGSREGRGLGAPRERHAGHEQQQDPTPRS
jgi:hypothetical protein